MIGIIAEKPSVAREIARIVGANQRHDGFIDGNGYKVTWAFGHLIQLASPAEYGFVGFKRESLPIIPDTFQLCIRQVNGKSDTGAEKQLRVIRDVFESVDRIIVATDAGREGELIFRYIYTYLGCQKPFDRLWISSLTDRAIRDGLAKLRSSDAYYNLYMAAKARSEADWIIGMNATQAITIASGGGNLRSLGRVQTPTLRMVCDRYLENKNFVPRAFWQLRLQTSASGTPFTATGVDQFDQEQQARAALESVRAAGSVTVQSISCKEVRQEPPLLFDLTALQKEANTKLEMTAESTLNIAQRLYEAKLITYPRTGSQYISEDVFETISALIENLADHVKFGEYARNLKTLNSRSVNDKKVTDHHALLITENRPGELTSEESAIYNMIAGRILQAFSGQCVKDITTAEVQGGGVSFEAKGGVIKQAGWREVYDLDTKGEKSEGEELALPALEQGELLPILELESIEKQTKPKPLHTEASLLAAMETAGKELEDEDLRSAMKICGLGTPATRAKTIETLIERTYIERKKRSLIPTQNGIAVYSAVKDLRISDVLMTGKWENALAKVEGGELSVDTFNAEIIKYAKQVTSELLSSKITSTPNSSKLKCPKCHQQSVRIFPKVANCNTEGCGFAVFRSILNKTLTDIQLTELITAGKSKEIKGLTGKSGKIFSAYLTFDQTYKVVFDFGTTKK